MEPKLKDMSAEELNKLAEDKKAKMEKTKATLDKAVAKYKAAKELSEKYQTRVNNTKEVDTLSDQLTNGADAVLKPLVKGVSRLKSQALQITQQAEDALEKVRIAKKDSDALQTHIEAKTKDKTPVSEDLASDSPTANASISKAWDDATAAYTSSMELYEMIIGMEQALVKINNQLRVINDTDAKNLNKIKSNFETLGPSKSEVESLEKANNNTTEYDDDNKEYTKVTNEINARKARKKIEDAINA